jgi:hypothetical protein
LLRTDRPTRRARFLTAVQEGLDSVLETSSPTRSWGGISTRCSRGMRDHGEALLDAARQARSPRHRGFHRAPRRACGQAMVARIRSRHKRLGSRGAAGSSRRSGETMSASSSWALSGRLSSPEDGGARPHGLRTRARALRFRRSSRPATPLSRVRAHERLPGRRRHRRRRARTRRGSRSAAQGRLPRCRSAPGGVARRWVKAGPRHARSPGMEATSSSRPESPASSCASSDHSDPRAQPQAPPWSAKKPGEVGTVAVGRVRKMYR